MLNLLIQTIVPAAPGISAYEFGQGIGYVIGGVCIMLLMGHICGIIAEGCGLEYWLFAPLGIFLNVLGVVITSIVYFVITYRNNNKMKEAIGRSNYYGVIAQDGNSSLAELLLENYPKEPPSKEATYNLSTREYE